MKAGWNYLGRYKFAEGEEAVVELSDRADGRGRLYADAVRWRFFDPENPDAYEDEMPTFTGRGRGGPGGGRGGGDRGGGDGRRGPGGNRGGGGLLGF